jgi:hypothetical protein
MKKIGARNQLEGSRIEGRSYSLVSAVTRRSLPLDIIWPWWLGYLRAAMCLTLPSSCAIRELAI